MKYPLVLFDADDTLFDFGRSEKHSFWTVLSGHGLVPTETVFDTYRKFSHGLWKKFEKGEISILDLRVDRYKMLVDHLGFDTDPRSLSEGYLDVLKHQTHLLDGAVELCQALIGKTRIGIVTNGIEEVQRHRLAQSAIAPYVEFVVVSEECGYAKPHRGIFDYTLKKAKHSDPSQILMVGDKLETDILGGKSAGMKTCWFNPTKALNQMNIQPDYEVSTLSEIREIVCG